MSLSSVLKTDAGRGSPSSRCVRRRPFARGRRATLVAFWLCAVLAASCPPASAQEVVPVTGGWLVRLGVDLRGVYEPVPGRPLAWSVVWGAAGRAERGGELEVTGEAFELRAALVWDAGTGTLRWRITRGRIGLGSWVAALAGRPEWSAQLAGLSAEGDLVVRGEGTWAGGEPTGRLDVEWREGALRHAGQGWSLEGVNLRAGGDVRGWLAGNVPGSLSVGTITTTRFGARKLSVDAALAGFGRLEIKAARVEIAGGEVEAEPFFVRLAEPVVDTTLTMRRVGLQDLVVFVPTALAEARGRIDGTLRLEWSRAEGLKVGAGELKLEKSEPTVIKLVSSPGFLTRSVPARFVLAPRWFGPFKRWFSPANPGYRTLSEIETGRLALRVESLEARLSPDGDARGRSATVVVRARPELAGGAVGEIIFEVNVSGPLASVLRAGLQRDFSLQAK